MRRRNVGQLFCTFVVVAMSALSAASCGSSDGGSLFVGPKDGGNDVTLPPFDGNFFSDAPTGGCMPKTCAELGYTCGKNGNGCGGELDCDLPDGASPCPP